jgi:hypothetical protein
MDVSVPPFTACGRSAAVGIAIPSRCSSIPTLPWRSNASRVASAQTGRRDILESPPVSTSDEKLPLPTKGCNDDSTIADDYLRLGPIAAREAAKFSLHLLGYL